MHTRGRRLDPGRAKIIPTRFRLEVCHTKMKRCVLAGLKIAQSHNYSIGEYPHNVLKRTMGLLQADI